MFTVPDFVDEQPAAALAEDGQYYRPSASQADQSR